MFAKKEVNKGITKCIVVSENTPEKVAAELSLRKLFVYCFLGS